VCEPLGTGNNNFQPGYILRAAYGGVLAMTNGTTIVQFNTAATPTLKCVLSTAGGDILIGALQVNGANNGLEPVVTAAHGTGCVTVLGTATFGADLLVWPSAEKGALAGEYTILTANNLVLNNSSEPRLAPGFDPSVWRVTSQPGANGWVKLRYSRGGTLFMVR